MRKKRKNRIGCYQKNRLKGVFSFERGQRLLFRLARARLARGLVDGTKSLAVALSDLAWQARLIAEVLRLGFSRVGVIAESSKILTECCKKLQSFPALSSLSEENLDRKRVQPLAFFLSESSSLFPLLAFLGDERRAVIVVLGSTRKGVREGVNLFQRMMSAQGSSFSPLLILLTPRELLKDTRASFLKKFMLSHPQILVNHWSLERGLVALSAPFVLAPFASLGSLLQRRSSGSFVVFVRKEREAERTAWYLRHVQQFQRVKFLHGNLFNEEREEVLRWFDRVLGGVLVTTESFLREESGRWSVRDLIFPIFPETPDLLMEGWLRFPLLENCYLFRLGRAEERESFVKCSGCRWLWLMKSLGQTGPFEICGKCDVCTNRVVEYPVEEKIISNLVFHRPRSLTVRRASLALKGYHTAGESLHLLREFGKLRSWDLSSIVEAIDLLIEKRRLKIVSRGPWRGTLVCTK